MKKSLNDTFFSFKKRDWVKRFVTQIMIFSFLKVDDLRAREKRKQKFRTKVNLKFALKICHANYHQTILQDQTKKQKLMCIFPCFHDKLDHILFEVAFLPSHNCNFTRCCVNFQSSVKWKYWKSLVKLQRHKPGAKILSWTILFGVWSIFVVNN